MVQRRLGVYRGGALPAVERVCHGVPRIPGNGTTIGCERRIKETADPVLPRSAAVGRGSAILHTHEVTGSSPVAPTNLRS